MTHRYPITPTTIAEAERMLAEGMDAAEVAERLGLSAYVIDVLVEDRRRRAEASADPGGEGK